ncbi:hypothetical protein QVD17_35635 [Tagetes erecta]|uniref:Uncharacterized protein n=1 Tax=Tagetes erecta TaxID=13708 RepID=A0AAD8NBA1_TARER|nr:hypothetical protein QVD17_35635 [Tagetes erecta]
MISNSVWTIKLISMQFLLLKMQAQVIHELKNYLKSCGADIQVIPKIESADSIPNLHLSSQLLTGQWLQEVTLVQSCLLKRFCCCRKRLSGHAVAWEKLLLLQQTCLKA